MAGSNIADENVEVFSFQNGLWNADFFGGNAPPARGFCDTLDNLYPDESGNLRIRPAIDKINGVTFTSKSSPAFPSPLHVATGTFSTNVPAKNLIADVYSGSGLQVWAMNHGYTQSGLAPIGILNNITGFVEANNYIYVCGSSGPNAVGRIDSITYGPVAISATAIAGAPYLDGMIYFRGRLFGFKDSTIYFTEAVSNAAPNPETWNTTTNNFVLGSEGTRPKIFQIMSFNDRIFVFTDSGIFVIVVQGSPASWIVKPFDLSVSVRTKECAVQYKGIMYIAAIDGVYVFTGGMPRLISEAISYYFKATTNWAHTKICIAGEFLILTLLTLQPDGVTKTQPLVYGMNLRNPGPWFSIKHSAVTGNMVILNSIKSIRVGANSVYDGLIVGVYNSTYSTLDTYLCGFVWGAGTENLNLSSQPITALAATSWQDVGSPYRLNHHKYSIVEWIECPSLFSHTTFIEGSPSVGGNSPAGAIPIEFKNAVKIPGADTPIRQGKIQISWVANTGLFSRLKAIYLIIGTERTIPDESSY